MQGIPNMKILLIEDDVCTASTLSKALTDSQYLVDTTNNGQTGLDLAATYEYDLILLNAMLPELDSIGLCHKLRSQSYQTPILMLTTKDTSNGIKGLEAGADDYIVKPFDWPELRARIRALLRRGKAPISAVLTWEKLHLDPNTRAVSYDGNPIHLTPKEYGSLELFLRNPFRVFSRSDILDSVWPLGEFPQEEAVTTHIKGLRQKLEAAGMTHDLLETLYGLGYRLKPEPITDHCQATARVRAIVTQMREEFKENLGTAIQLFQQAIDCLFTRPLDHELQQKVQAEAHRLIGSLGSLGSSEGSEVARKIEQLLQTEPTPGDCAALQLSELVTQLQQAVEASNRECMTSSPNPPARLLVIDGGVLTEQISEAAVAWGLKLEKITDLESAKKAIAQTSPDVILLDLSSMDRAKKGLMFLEEMAEQRPEIPVLVVTQQDQLNLRVKVAHIGRYTFLQKPVSPENMLRAVTKALSQRREVEAKVMVVDDDPQVLAVLPDLLEPWGLQVTTLADPQQFWEVLEATTPDLLILDVEMPHFSGLDLCQVVRNDARWGEIPVLFLSAHRDAETVCQVFAVGADDYVGKPIVKPELVSRVLNRLERVHMRRKLARTRMER
jgi:DNA-binding response OmpR family regulator